jgi:hypothetical protein
MCDQFVGNTGSHECFSGTGAPNQQQVARFSSGRRFPRIGAAGGAYPLYLDTRRYVRFVPVCADGIFE